MLPTISACVVGLYAARVGRWYEQAVAEALELRLLKPGESKAVVSTVLLSVKNKAIRGHRSKNGF